MERGPKIPYQETVIKINTVLNQILKNDTDIYGIFSLSQVQEFTMS